MGEGFAYFRWYATKWPYLSRHQSASRLEWLCGYNDWCAMQRRANTSSEASK